MTRRQIVLDTETTGLSPKSGHRIIEIGCLELIGRRLTGSQLHYYLNPERAIDAGAEAVHGINLQMLVDKPVFADIADELVEYIRGAELIIHNAPFDVGFLNHELNLLGSRKAQHYSPISHYCTVFDTLSYARKKHPGQKNNLDALCRRYKVDAAERTLHGALLDAELLAAVYLGITGGQASLFGGTHDLHDSSHQDLLSSQQHSHAHAQTSDTRQACPQQEYQQQESVQQAFGKQASCHWQIPVQAPTESEQAAHDVFLALLETSSDGTERW